MSSLSFLISPFNDSLQVAMADDYAMVRTQQYDDPAIIVRSFLRNGSAMNARS
ncbi:hypothetical protein [Ruegeria arenilitoris]|uniref:hypothetical protein n=1 Tax=Ruegeria arenilitoris TaxID=1173585 RepID=UPI001480D88C|nr:hypothetical protein [Ruegeria arenilitoris]